MAPCGQLAMDRNPTSVPLGMDDQLIVFLLLPAISRFNRGATRYSSAKSPTSGRQAWQGCPSSLPAPWRDMPDMLLGTATAAGQGWARNERQPWVVAWVAAATAGMFWVCVWLFWSYGCPWLCGWMPWVWWIPRDLAWHSIWRPQLAKAPPFAPSGKR